MKCRHCRKKLATRPRRLCFRCYFRRRVRERYPSKGGRGNRGLGNFYRNAPLPAFPTQALPGTPEKIAVLEERARLKQCLWHPDDATDAVPGTPLLRAG